MMRLLVLFEKERSRFRGMNSSGISVRLNLPKMLPWICMYLLCSRFVLLPLANNIWMLNKVTAM